MSTNDKKSKASQPDYIISATPKETQDYKAEKQNVSAPKQSFPRPQNKFAIPQPKGTNSAPPGQWDDDDPGF